MKSYAEQQATGLESAVDYAAPAEEVGGEEILRKVNDALVGRRPLASDFTSWILPPMHQFAKEPAEPV